MFCWKTAIEVKVIVVVARLSLSVVMSVFGCLMY